MTTVLLGRFDPADDGGLHGLVRRFRAGDRRAFAEVVERARAPLGAAWPADTPPPVLVPVPGHAPAIATAMGDEPRIALARALARELGWSSPQPPPLRRIRAVAPAKHRGPRDPDDETASLAWHDAGLAPGAAIVLLDDVLATGGTLDACLAAIRRDAPARVVEAVVLARAVGGATSGAWPPRSERRTGRPAPRA